MCDTNKKGNTMNQVINSKQFEIKVSGAELSEYEQDKLCQMVKAYIQDERRFKEVSEARDNARQIVLETYEKLGVTSVKGGDYSISYSKAIEGKQTEKKVVNESKLKWLICQFLAQDVDCISRVTGEVMEVDTNLDHYYNTEVKNVGSRKASITVRDKKDE